MDTEGDRSHALPIRCEHCGETTRLRLDDEQALRLAHGLLTSALGLPPQPPGYTIKGD